MTSSITINSELMDRLQVESDKTGLKIDELVESLLTDNLNQSADAIVLRDIPLSQQRDEILEYLKLHEVADALEIADVLRLDVFDVNEIMVELINQGILEEL